tara:strand:- start:47455 stop:47778 length:324 start_codon:yes stop_codon:yes gene_type:complete
MLSFKEFINERLLTQNKVLDKLKSLLDTNRYTIEKRGLNYLISWGKGSINIGSGYSYEDAFNSFVRSVDLDGIYGGVPDELFELFEYGNNVFSQDSKRRQIDTLMGF